MVVIAYRWEPWLLCPCGGIDEYSRISPHGHCHSSMPLCQLESRTGVWEISVDSRITIGHSTVKMLRCGSPCNASISAEVLPSSEMLLSKVVNVGCAHKRHRGLLALCPSALWMRC